MTFEAVASIAILELPLSVCIASIINPAAKATRTDACRRRLSGGALK